MTIASRKIRKEIEDFEKSTDDKKIQEFGYHFLQLMDDYHVSMLIQNDFHKSMQEKNKKRMVFLANQALQTIEKRIKSKPITHKRGGAWNK